MPTTSRRSSMAGLTKGFVYDKRTGKKRRVNRTLSKLRKKSSRRLRNRHLNAQHRRKISKGVKRARKLHKTRGGRKVKYRRRMGGSNRRRK